MGLDLEHINEFLVAAKYLNLTQAAEKLYISRSSLSRHISELEKSAGVLLFTRNYHALELTDAGRYLVREGTRMSEHINDMAKTLRTFDRKDSYSLSVCSANFYLPQLFDSFHRFRADHPNVDFAILNASLPEILNSIEENQVDFVVTFSFSLWGKNMKMFRMEVLSHSHFSVIMSSKHPLTGKDVLTIEDLRKYRVRYPMAPLILQEHLLLLRDNYESCASIPAPLEFVNPTPLDMVFLNINTSNDLALLPFHVAQNASQGCIVKDIVGLQTPFDIVMLYRASNRNLCLRQFLEEQIIGKYPCET